MCRDVVKRENMGIIIMAGERRKAAPNVSGI